MIRAFAIAASTSLLLLLGLACTGKTKLENPEGQQPAAATIDSQAESRTLGEEIDQLPEAIAPDGDDFSLELALTPEETAQGLMFRPHLAENRGMLFIFKQERIRSFWMKNTLIPLDIIFLDSTGRVADISANATPCHVEPCPQFVSLAPARAVLELNAGAAAAHKIEVGSVIRFRNVPHYPLISAEATEQN